MITACKKLGYFNFILAANFIPSNDSTDNPEFKLLSAHAPNRGFEKLSRVNSD